MQIIHAEISTDKSQLAVSMHHDVKTIVIERSGEGFAHSFWQDWELNAQEEEKMMALVAYIAGQMDVLKEMINGEESVRRFTPDDKHNWFEVDGDIRVSEHLTTKEMTEKLDKAGFEFLGKIGYSTISDEDYE